jgi:hypothetical protein
MAAGWSNLNRRPAGRLVTSEGLEKTVIRGLAKDSQWVQNHENLFVLGLTGVGKSQTRSTKPFVTSNASRRTEAAVAQQIGRGEGRD